MPEALHNLPEELHLSHLTQVITEVGLWHGHTITAIV